MNQTTNITHAEGATGRGRQAAANDSAHVPGVRHDWVTVSLRAIEPLVASALALYTAWIALTALPGEPGPWLAVGYAALIAKWCCVRPAHRQSEVFLRGVALIAGAWLLHSPVEAVGTGGPFFLWLSITVLCYAFILQPAWAAGLVALTVLEFLAAQWQPAGIRWSQVAAPVGFLAIFPLVVAMCFGAVMRRSDETAELGRLDASTGLFNMAGFLEHGRELVQECAAEGKPSCVAVFDCDDLQELRMVYGRSTSRKVMARLVRKLNAIAGDRGLAARTTATEFTLLLPGLTPEKAYLAIERALGRPGCIEYDAGDSEIVMLPGIVVHALGMNPDALATSHEKARDELHKTRREQELRVNYLTRERERHSRPSPLATVPAALPRRAHSLARTTAATMPVPLLRAG